MAHDAYGRPQRDGSVEHGYFPDHASSHNLDSSFIQDTSPSDARHQQAANDRMISSLERPEPAGYDKVSPELIKVITEQVKKEVVEHLNRTGRVEGTHKAPLMERDASNKSSSTSTPSPTATPPSPVQAQTQPSKPIYVGSPVEQAREPVKESVRESVREPFREPAREPVREWVREPARSPIREVIREHVREPAREPVRSPPGSPLEKPSGVRFSDRTPVVRPQPSGRTFSTMELSTIDQKWGRLFDNDGHPTPRLGQFLRGLANHIIDDFDPIKSIVVPPAKMAMYYSSHPLDKEPNALLSIFRSQSNEYISRLYQDLGCQHHLIQEHSSNAPTIPALTALGFAQWMTIHILAYPDEESKRLESVVLAMPIDADGDLVDGKPERLPKQISRHLLPNREHHKSRRLLEKAFKSFWNDEGSSSRRNPSVTSPPLSRNSSSSHSRPHPVEIHQTKTSPKSSKAAPIERERSPYAGAPVSETSSIDEPVKIERDRQPYTAQPGNGKVYYEESSLDTAKLGRTNSPASRTREPEPVETREARHSQTKSNASQTKEPEPVETRDSQHHRTRSNASQNTYMPSSRHGGRRTSSPPLKKYSDSTPIEIDAGGFQYGMGPASTTSSFSTQSQPASFPPPPPPIDSRDPRERRSRDDRSHRRGTDEEPRFAGEFSSPKDAEKWDRYQDAREAERSERTYESRAPVSSDHRDHRSTVSGDPRDHRSSVPSGPRDPRGPVSTDPRETNRDSRGAAYEDWYREKPRGTAYEAYTPRNY